MTLQQKYLTALTQRGWQQLESRSARFIKLGNPKCINYLFLGKNGSLRMGKTRSDSIPVSDKLKLTLLEEQL